jgi:5-formyltetrahydrofolate cyclo-ligase
VFFDVKGMKVYVPRIEDKESHMRMLHITNTDDDLIANHMNILEPTPLGSDGNPRLEGVFTRSYCSSMSYWH